MADAELTLRSYGEQLDELCPELTFTDVQRRLNQEQTMTLITDEHKVRDDEIVELDLHPRDERRPPFLRGPLIAAMAAAIVLVVALAVVLAGDNTEPVITDEPTTTTTEAPTTTAPPTVPEVSADARATIDAYLAATTAEELAATMTADGLRSVRGYSGFRLESNAEIDEMLEAERIIQFEVTVESCETAGAETIIRCSVTATNAITQASGQEPRAGDLTFNLVDGLISVNPNKVGGGIYSEVESWATDASLEDEFSDACPLNTELTIACAEFAMQLLDDRSAE